MTLIKEDTEKYRVKSTLDKFQVISKQAEYADPSSNLGWTRKVKDHTAYLKERKEWEDKKTANQATKL